MTAWQTVDTQPDLTTLRESVCWEDCETIEYYVTHSKLCGFPSEINRTGQRLPNVYILIDACSQQGRWLEMVWIHADNFDSHFAQHPFVAGRVDSLMRVEITDNTQRLRMRCARLIYRFRDDLAELPCHHFARMFCEVDSPDF